MDPQLKLVLLIIAIFTIILLFLLAFTLEIAVAKRLLGIGKTEVQPDIGASGRLQSTV